MNVDLFDDEGASLPCPAWRVIEAARRQYLTGELVLETSPPTHVYLRDGQVYFAERSTDGGLGVRLLVEGVITRAQLQRGTLLVSGAEHLGRLFERDSSIERESVELCVELMTDEVLVAVATEDVSAYRMTLYKRHASGIDRWMPTKVEVVTRLIERPEHADAGAHLEPAPAARTRPTIQPTAVPVAVPVEMPAEAPAAVPVAAAAEAPETVAEAPALAPVAAAAAMVAPEPAVAPLRPAEPVTQVLPIEPEFAFASAPPAEAVLTPEPVAAPLPPPTPAFGLPAVVVPPPPYEEPERVETVHIEAPAYQPVLHDDGSASAQPIADMLLSASIADEVAEAVRRALAAIDANQPMADPSVA